MLTLQARPVNRIEDANKLISRLRRERRALEQLAQTIDPEIRPLLEELGKERWGHSLLRRTFTILGPIVSHGGIEWAVREGKWKNTQMLAAEVAGRTHEYYILRLAFDGTSQPSFFQIKCDDTIGSHDIRPESLRTLLSKARRLGPARQVVDEVPQSRFSFSFRRTAVNA